MYNLIGGRFSQTMLLTALLWVMGSALSYSVPGLWVGTAQAKEKVAGEMNANPCAAKSNPCSAKANPCAEKKM
jgi:hypothetical protein